ncbi:MAG: hypothetical protein KDA90_12260 [Planctomycetaceae bacterium]|nr:hypothetical protein [Planctomycetaceae bacterium]
MICQNCGVEAPTKYVAFHQNIGALVMRFSKSIEGELCKSCVHKNFWSMTGTTLVLGWWGLISFVLTIGFVLNNVIRYLLCLGMDPVPLDAVAPRLTEADVERIEPFAEELFDRLQVMRDPNLAEPFDEVATDIANRARVTPGQILLFLRAVVAQQHPERFQNDAS